MRRTVAASALAVLLVLCLGTSRGQGPAVDLKLEGAGVSVVKVDRVVVIKEDMTLVASFPFTVHAAPGAGLYFWSYPAGVQATDQNDKLVVTFALKGMVTVGVKAVTADLDKDGKFRGFITRLGSVTFAVGDVPAPPDPKPPDPKPPDPKPPGPVAGLRVLMVEESADRGKLTAGQQSVLFGKTVRDWLEANCAADPGMASGKGWTIQDKDTDVSAFGKVWVDLMARPRTALPWVVISGDGGVVHEGPLPADVPSMLNLLGKFAPAKRKAG